MSAFELQINIGLNTDENFGLSHHFAIEEIRDASNAGGSNRAPGLDGLGMGFYRATWNLIHDDLERILNETSFEVTMTPQQKRGTIVCIPKKQKVLTPADTSPITLMNADYKLVARIIARRLRPLLKRQLHSTQYCGVSGNSILEAVAAVRDTIDYAEQMNKPLCVLALDFKNAFDRISHEYIYTILNH
jgi:hypothetical protein